MNMRPNIVLAVITTVIVALAVVAVIFAVRQPPVAPAPNSPEGVVRAYGQAVVDRNYSAAVTLLDPQLDCTSQHFRTSYYPENTAMTFMHSDVAQRRSNVTVEISTYGDAFAGPGAFEETFDLKRTGDTWRITGKPWPIYSCEATR